MGVLCVEILTERDDSIRKIVLSGRLDTESSQELCPRVCNLMTNQPMLVSLKKCNYISSAGVRALLVIAREAKEKGIKLRFSDAQPMVYDVLDMIGFLPLIEYRDTAAEAEAELL